jgi:serine/threonine-protein kinase RsbW
MLLKDFILADEPGVSQALATIKEFVEGTSVPRSTCVRVLLIAEELLVNVIKHGRPPVDSRIDFEFGFMNDRIKIRLTDAGAPFDPRTDIPASSRQNAILAGIEGGVGWPLILRWCDIVAYERTGGHNRLTLSLPLTN